MADVTVVADPIELTASIEGLGLVMWAVASPIPLTTQLLGSFEAQTISTPRNPELDTLFDCSRLGNDGLPIGIIQLTTTILGTWLNVGVVASPIEVVTSVHSGAEFAGEMFSTTSLFELTVSIGGGGTYTAPTMITTPAKSNWVKWGNIGSIDFTIWKDNIAGERPLDWKGWVYEIKKLGNKVVVYGQNGVSLLVPTGNTYGLLPVHDLGLKGKQAVSGSNSVHFFVDSNGVLFSLGENTMKASLFEASIYPDRLDYSEYLSDMSNPVLSWDKSHKLLYICDGMLGYVYSPSNKSLGSGPINVTGVGEQSGTLYVGASSTIVTPAFEMCTDIYDMGSRKNKTISSFEIGTDASGDLWAAIDYRLDKAEAFKTTQWVRVNPNGIVNLPCFGVEFRFRLKQLVATYIEIDYIKVNGVIHNYSYLDTYARGGTE